MTNPILAAIAARATQTPEAPVLVGSHQVWRAAPLIAAIDSLAGRLAGCRCLATLADNGPDWVVADLAALAAGVPQVPLPPFFSPQQLAHALDASGADCVLTDQPERIVAIDAGFTVSGRWDGLVRLSRPATGPLRLPAGTAKISFTSGSTGQPKGVCLTAASLYATAEAVAARLTDLPIARHLAALPLALLLENTAGVYAPLLRGAEVHLPGLAELGWQGMAGFDPARLQQAAAAAQANSVILVPELLKAWSLFLAASGQRAPADLVFAAVGGARVDAAAIAAARAVGLPAYQGYGLTECGSVVSLNRPGDAGDGSGDDVGRPLAHVAVRIADGEVVVASPAFAGYLATGDEAATAGGSPAAGFATGDLGQLDAAGHLHLSGRRKNLLITSYGRNVAPEWVEAALLAQPAIGQALVAGDGCPWLAAVVVPVQGADAAALAAAIAGANSGLPDYARVGAWLAADAFTPANGLATGNGRLRRAAILARYAEPLAALYATKYNDPNRKESTDVLL